LPYAASTLSDSRGQPMSEPAGAATDSLHCAHPVVEIVKPGCASRPSLHPARRLGSRIIIAVARQDSRLMVRPDALQMDCDHPRLPTVGHTSN